MNFNFRAFTMGILFSAVLVCSEEIPKDTNSAYYVSIGVSSNHLEFIPRLNATATGNFRWGMLTLHSYNASTGASNLFEGPSRHVYDVGLLYGRRLKIESLFATPSIGPGFVWGGSRASINWGRPSVIGRVEFTNAPWKYTGYAFAFFVGLNTKAPYIGLSGSICLGKLR